jgi:undecaprenyl-diphosphatase
MRDRPSPFFDTPLPSSYSFPSGHALCSLCFYGSLAWIYAAHVRSKLAQASMWLLSALLIFLIGLSRVYLGVHYPSDVLAGYAAAFVWFSAVIWADTLFNKRKNRSG